MDGSRDKDVRRKFLERQLRALIARIDVLSGMRRSFAEESRLLFGVDPPRAPDREGVEATRAALDRLIPGRGDLAQRVAEFHRRFVVSPERLPATFARALAACRAATLRHIALPADERVDVDYVTESPWTAFTRYVGDHRSRITINSETAFSVNEVLELACHEGYPGHHVVGVLVDDSLVRARGRVELSVQPLFSPQALLAEGAASVAPQLAFTDAERVQFEQGMLGGVDPRDVAVAIEVDRLLDGLNSVRTDIGARYLDGTLEFARAAVALEHDALMPFPDPLLKFLNEFRTYGVTYARGPELAAADLNTAADERDGSARWRAYVQLVTNPSQSFEQKLK